MFSTSGDVQHIGGCSVHSGYHEYIGGYHEYIGRCLVHRGDIMGTSWMFSTSRGYHDACGGYHVYIGGYHEYIGEIS